MSIDFIRRSLLAVAALSAAGTVAAQTAPDDFPNRPIRIIVPYAPGGGTDTIGRLVAAKLAENWKASVVVENKPGAGGVLGTDQAVKAPADGYTVLLGITALAQQPAMMAKLPYDLLRDLRPLTVVARSADLLMVHKDVPANTLQEFLALAKADPKNHALGIYGNGTSAHVHAAMLNSQAGLDLAIVTYKGAGPMVIDLLGGQVRAAFVDSTTAQPHMAGGRLKALAVTGARPSPLAPAVPTFTQLGYKSFEPFGWFALFTQAATPPAIAKKLSDEMIAIIAQPEVRKRLLELGLQPGGDAQADWSREMRADLDVWSRVIKEANIRAE